MVNFYVRQITVYKTMTINQVPVRWREDVRRALENMGIEIVEG